MLTFEDFNAVIHSPVADFHKHSPNVILTCCVFFNTRIQSRNINCIGLFTSLIFFKTASLSLGGVWWCGGGWVWVWVCVGVCGCGCVCAVLCCAGGAALCAGHQFLSVCLKVSDAQLVHWVKVVPPDVCVTKVLSLCWWLVSDPWVIFEYSLLILPESVFTSAVTEHWFSILRLFFDWHSPPDHLDGFFRFKLPVFSSGKPALTGSLTPMRSVLSYTPALCLCGTCHNYNSVIVQLFTVSLSVETELWAVSIMFTAANPAPSPVSGTQ